MREGKKSRRRKRKGEGKKIYFCEKLKFVFKSCRTLSSPSNLGPALRNFSKSFSVGLF